MNQRNAAALRKAIEHIRDAAAGAFFGDSIHLTDDLLAEAMAREGVLAPSALTTQEVADLFDVPALDRFREIRVADLERIAKGEDR
jgi:hypothetical protein